MMKLIRNGSSDSDRNGIRGYLVMGNVETE